jgi:hypothetical protein
MTRELVPNPDQTYVQPSDGQVIDVEGHIIPPQEPRTEGGYTQYQEDPGPSFSQKYRTVIQDCVARYVFEEGQITKARAAVTGGLDRIYARFPHTNPANLSLHIKADAAFREYVLQTDDSQGESPEDLAVKLSTENDKRQDYGTLTMTAAAIAASAARRHDPAVGGSRYDALLSKGNVLRQARSYLNIHLGLFAVRGITQLPPDVLAAENLDPLTINWLRRGAALMPDNGRTDIIELQAPPLPLLQLSADVMTYNARSALPADGLKGRARRFAKPGMHAYNDEHAHAVNIGLAAYLTEKYHLDLPDKDRETKLLLSVMAECDLALVMGFVEREEVRQWTATRNHDLFRRWGNRPMASEAARFVVDNCLQAQLALPQARPWVLRRQLPPGRR